MIKIVKHPWKIVHNCVASLVLIVKILTFDVKIRSYYLKFI